MVRKAHAKEAAVCVNVGYSVDDETKIRDRISLDYKMGNLHTEYVVSKVELSCDSTANLWI